MNEECLICKAPLEYLDADEEMECGKLHRFRYPSFRNGFNTFSLK